MGLTGAFSLDFIQKGLWIKGDYGNAPGSVDTPKDKTFLLSLSFGPPDFMSNLGKKIAYRSASAFPRFPRAAIGHRGVWVIWFASIGSGWRSDATEEGR